MHTRAADEPLRFILITYQITDYWCHAIIVSCARSHSEWLGWTARLANGTHAIEMTTTTTLQSANKIIILFAQCQRMATNRRFTDSDNQHEEGGVLEEESLKRNTVQNSRNSTGGTLYASDGNLKNARKPKETSNNRTQTSTRDGVSKRKEEIKICSSTWVRLFGRIYNMGKYSQRIYTESRHHFASH